MDDNVKKLIEWIADNVHDDIIHDAHVVEADPLVLKISELWALDDYEVRDVIMYRKTN